MEYVSCGDYVLESVLRAAVGSFSSGQRELIRIYEDAQNIVVGFYVFDSSLRFD